ncbi:lipoyl(octanoyl) transferase LipB, partial [Salmonella enterica]|uniref:lipoyl(octanoyl) transferase LipB n=1 Tax=Salmonella enterica TaxID=28901 RepID=UPI00398C30DA
KRERRKLGGWRLVSQIGEAGVNRRGEIGIEAVPRDEGPGDYVGEKKICTVGIRIRSGCSFHGLEINVNMDLSPFMRINPCGYAAMAMAKITQRQEDATTDTIATRFPANMLALINKPPHQYSVPLCVVVNGTNHLGVTKTI